MAIPRYKKKKIVQFEKSIMYGVALFCIACLCVSLVLHDSCYLNSSLHPDTCNNLRRFGTFAVVIVALAALKRATYFDEVLALLLIVALGMFMACAKLRTKA
jgi:hypothetical protein